MNCDICHKDTTAGSHVTRGRYFEVHICPHCKNITGWREVIPVHGHYAEHYDENGEFEVGAYSDSMNYYEKSRKYECTRCNRNIKAAVLRYKRGMNK